MLLSHLHCMMALACYGFVWLGVCGDVSPSVKKRCKNNRLTSNVLHSGIPFLRKQVRCAALISHHWDLPRPMHLRRQKGWQPFAMRLHSAGCTLQHPGCSTSFSKGPCSCGNVMPDTFGCVLMVAHLIPYLRSMLWQAYARVAGIGAPCCHSCIVAIVARIAESATSAAGGYSQ